MKIQIYNYTNYKSFLKEFHQLSLKNKVNWSLGVWSNQIGLKSKSTLAMILNGDRHPGKDVKSKMIKYFSFKDKEKDYFEKLIELQKSKNPEYTVFLMEKLKSLHPKKNFKLLSSDEFEVISNWHYYIIREMIAWPSFKEDPDWISEQLLFKFTPRECKRCLNDLESLELIKRENNKFVLNDLHLSSSDEVASEALKRYHEQSLEVAKSSVRKFEPRERYLSGISINIDPEKLSHIKDKIRLFEDELINLFDEPNKERIYQFNIQLFPTSKEKKR